MSPTASLQSDPSSLTLEVCCHLPLALGNAEAQAALNVWFRLERLAGPLAQGKIIRSATLPPGGTVRLIPSDAQSHFILETDGLSVFRCETNPAETAYMETVTHNLRHLGRARTDRLTPSLASRGQMMLAITPVSFPFLHAVLQQIVDHSEAQSRLSETAARSSRLSPRPAGETAAQTTHTRILTNPNRQRALTLFFYRAEKYEMVRCGLRQIERVVTASNEALADAVRADIDRRLLDLALLDAQGQVTPAAQQRYSWQRSFQLPTPHVMVKTCPNDSLTDSAVFGAIKIDLWQQHP